MKRAWLITGLCLVVMCCGLQAFAGPVELAQELTDLLVKGEYSQVVAHFDETMAKQVPAEKLHLIWSQLLQQVGAFEQQKSVDSQPYQQYVIVKVVCKFEKATLGLKYTFDKQERVAGFFIVPAEAPAAWKPPAYARPEAFTEVEVTFGLPQWRLPGTLSLPKGEGPFPAVVLVHGSGPNDRDETILANKPFKDLAWGLASRGIAVLRYDKRTKVYAGKFTKEQIRQLTVQQETLDDAVEAVKFLAGRPEIDKQRIFVLGHSLGGMLIPRLAKQTQQAAGFIVMAGANRPLEQALVEQQEYLAKLDGKVTQAEQAELDRTKALIKELEAPDLSPDLDKEFFGAYPRYWLDLRGYKPSEAAKTIERPLLVLQGGRDFQVTVKELEKWKADLAGHKNVTFKLYPDLNHLFLAGAGPSGPQEYNKPGHVAQQVITDLASWILQPSPAAADSK